MPSPNLQAKPGFPTRRRHYDTQSELAASSDETRGLQTLSAEQFDRLLDWLDPDRKRGEAKYESVRKRLMKIFVCRGANNPEELADNTICCVARNLPEVRGTYVGEPAHYFCGVASNIFRESLRKDRVPAVMLPEPSRLDEDDERDYPCLERCIDKLLRGDRDLVLAYYHQEKHARVDHRKKLAEQLGLGMDALRIRACRIRAGLLKCVEQCRSEGEQAVK